jgi:hypothetical protein
MKIHPHEPNSTNTEVTVLERKLVDSHVAISKYKAGKSVVTVKSLFSLEKTFQDLLFQIIRNKLKK